eukprot:COSAG02_NODE_87_length_38906_cov_69.688697_20_plen_445_part_00
MCAVFAWLVRQAQGNSDGGWFRYLTQVGKVPIAGLAVPPSPPPPRPAVWSFVEPTVHRTHGRMGTARTSMKATASRSAVRYCSFLALVTASVVARQNSLMDSSACELPRLWRALAHRPLLHVNSSVVTAFVASEKALKSDDEDEGSGHGKPGRSIRNRAPTTGHRNISVSSVQAETCCDDIDCPWPQHKEKRGGWFPDCCFAGSCCRCVLGPPPPPAVCVPGVDVPDHKVPYFGFKEMLNRNNTEIDRTVRFPGRSQQALNFVDGDKHIHLTYDVEHHDAPLLALDHDEECVESVVCTSREEFVVTFCNMASASTAVVDFAGDGLLAGGSHWNCSEDGSGAPKVILRKTHGVSRDARDNRTIRFFTSQAKYHDFFKTANVRFGTNLWYDMHRHTHTHTEYENSRNDDLSTTGTPQRPVQGWFDQGFPGFLRECAQTVQTIVRLL